MKVTPGSVVEVTSVSECSTAKQRIKASWAGKICALRICVEIKPGAFEVECTECGERERERETCGTGQSGV